MACINSSPPFIKPNRHIHTAVWSVLTFCFCRNKCLKCLFLDLHPLSDMKVQTLTSDSKIANALQIDSSSKYFEVMQRLIWNGLTKDGLKTKKQHNVRQPSVRFDATKPFFWDNLLSCQHIPNCTRSELRHDRWCEQSLHATQIYNWTCFAE